jgi:hypothetical protein
MLSRLSAAVVLTGLAAVLATAADAQQAPRQGVSVDYVGVEGIYLPVGNAEGAQVGDTLSVFASDTASVPMGQVYLSAASRSRSVAQPIDGITLARGELIWLELVPPVEAAAQAVAAPTAASVGATPRTSATTVGGPRLSGRIGLDLDARETRTSFEGVDLFGTTRRRYATPVSTLNFRLSDLPGGFTVESNIRASYRYSDGVPIDPETSVRVYNLSVSKEFESAPVQIRLGRFYNPYETYSTYWDGALLRVGNRGVGIGAVAGFDPERTDEAPSTNVTKITGFADVSQRFGAIRYDADVSYHILQSKLDSVPDHSFAGWTQRISIGRFDVNQRLRMDRDDASGTWSLAQVRVRGGFLIGSSFRLRGGFGRTRPGVLRGEPADSSLERDEITGGFSVFGSTSTLGIDFGSSNWADEGRGLTVSGNANTRLGGLRLYASGSRWWRGDQTSLSVAPGFGFQAGWLTTRLGYQLYRTQGTATLMSHAGSIELSATPTARLFISVRGEQQWGSNFKGTRIRLSLGRSF